MCVTVALDARTRSSIYQNLVPILGEHDANELMSEFPSIEADELVTKQFLRAELGELRVELAQALHRQTVMLGSAMAGAIAASTALLLAALAAFT
jgi:hypothetical protein